MVLKPAELEGLCSDLQHQPLVITVHCGSQALPVCMISGL